MCVLKNFISEVNNHT